MLAGRRVDEGAAVVSRLSLGDQSVRIGRRGTLAQVSDGMKTPSVVIIGHVALHPEHVRALAAGFEHAA